MDGIITGIHRCALDDGPGIRTAVFLKGCALRCAWCHNPETQSGSPELMVYPERCTRCGRCAPACPLSLWDADPRTGRLDRARCTGCGRCAVVCPSRALVTAGERMTVEEVMRVVALDKPFYDDTGGGLTLTGGDPLMQAEFSAALLAGARRLGIHTCVETSGVGPPGALERLLPWTDLWLFDIKGTPEDYQKYTIGPNGTATIGDTDEAAAGPVRRVRHSLDVLRRSGASIILRCPIIPGIHDGEGYPDYLDALRAECPPGIELHRLPYHAYGADKYAALGREAYIPDGRNTP